MSPEELARRGAGWLETERLWLRPFRLDDLEDLHRVVGEDPEMSWTGEPLLIEDVLDVLQRRVRHHQEWGFGVLAVIGKATGRFTGQAGLQRVRSSSEVELVCSIARAHWRQGFASESCARLLDYGFRELGLSRITADVRPDNLRVQGLLLKLGFALAGPAQRQGRLVQRYGRGSTEP